MQLGVPFEFSIQQIVFPYVRLLCCPLEVDMQVFKASHSVRCLMELSHRLVRGMSPESFRSHLSSQGIFDFHPVPMHTTLNTCFYCRAGCFQSCGRACTC
jgi:hypothetical protein